MYGICREGSQAAKCMIRRGLCVYCTKGVKSQHAKLPPTSMLVCCRVNLCKKEKKNPQKQASTLAFYFFFNFYIIGV